MLNHENFRMLYLEDGEEARIILRAVHARMEAEGTAKTTFYDGTVTNAEEFVADVLRPGSLPFLMFWSRRPVAFVWLNTLEGRSARIHFSFFREAWGRETTVALGKRGLEHLLTRKDNLGYFFDVILCVVPERNTLARRYMLFCGAKEVGIIPHGAYVAANRATENAVLAVVTREIMGITE